MVEKVGVQAVFDDRDFVKGLRDYLSGVEVAEDKTERAAKEMTKSTKGFSEAWVGAGALVAASGAFIADKLAQMASRAIQSFSDLAALGAQSLRTKDSFNQLAASIGETGETLLVKMREASTNTVSDLTLMQVTAGLLASGIRTSTEEIELALAIAQVKARQFGLSTEEAYSRMVTGARKFSVEMLDELGIMIKAEGAYKRRAEALNKTTKELTDAERAEALWLAILDDGRQLLADTGTLTADSAQQMEDYATAISNAKAALGEALAPAVADVTSTLQELIPVFTEEMVPAIGGVTEAVGDLIAMFAELAAGPAAKLIVDLAEDVQLLAASIALYAAAAEGKISWLEAIGTDLKIAQIAADQGTDAMLAYVDTVINGADAHGTLATGVHKTENLHQIWNATVAETETVALRAAAGVRELMASFTVTPIRTVLAQAQAVKKATVAAAEERVKANEQALKEMERNEQSYANALGQLYDQIVTAGQRAAQDRLKADQDYADAALKLEQDLADERAQILRDLAQADEDARRKADQDREDAARKLARDLEDLQLRLAERNADTWADYYRTIEELALEHGERLKSITEQYASEAEAIAKKYSLEPEPPSVDAQREALQAEIQAIKERARKTGALNLGRLQQAEAELEALKQAELAALDERKQAELAAEEAAYQEQITREQQRREEQLAANQAQYDKEAEQKRLAYDRELEDLRVAQAREQDERNVAAQRALDDLQRQGEAQRAELANQYRARLAEITQGLATESQAFRDAYTNELRDLDTYLAQRTQKWQDHKRQIEELLLIRSPSRWMEDIGRQMRAGLDKGFSGPSLATDLQQAVASFGRMGNSLGLPMAAGGGSSTSNVTTNHNLSVNATYTRPQSERSLRQDLSLYHTMLRMRTG